MHFSWKSVIGSLLCLVGVVFYVAVALFNAVNGPDQFWRGLGIAMLLAPGVLLIYTLWRVYSREQTVGNIIHWFYKNMASQDAVERYGMQLAVAGERSYGHAVIEYNEDNDYFDVTAFTATDHKERYRVTRSSCLDMGDPTFSYRDLVILVAIVESINDRIAADQRQVRNERALARGFRKRFGRKSAQGLARDDGSIMDDESIGIEIFDKDQT